MKDTFNDMFRQTRFSSASEIRELPKVIRVDIEEVR
jgi:hypothetical protein